MNDDAGQIAHDIAAVGRIEAVPTMLKVLCETTGMGFAAVARVTGGSWTACAVRDEIAFGLKPGGQLEVGTTICKEAREEQREIVFEHASEHPIYRSHHTPRLYNIESYVSVPIVLSDGEFFGTLCAIDPRPAKLPPSVVNTFKLFAELVALQLENERKHVNATAQLFDEQQTGALREQFLAVLGHDLRNPLASISACGQLLERKASDPMAVADLARRIGKSTRRMASLIEDVLDFARSRLGSGIDVRIEPVADLQPAIEAIVAELADAHPGRIQADLSVDGQVACDRGRVQQLVSNLLANALVHGARDQPVTLRAARDAGSLTISVGNAGEPIAPEARTGMFSPFWRRNDGSRRSGLGLGLYICDQIVRAHGGTLEMSSDAAETRFTAKLPIAPC